MDEVEAEEEEEDIWVVWADGFSQGWDQVRRYCLAPFPNLVFSATQFVFLANFEYFFCRLWLQPTKLLRLLRRILLVPSNLRLFRSLLLYDGHKNLVSHKPTKGP